MNPYVIPATRHHPEELTPDGEALYERVSEEFERGGLDEEFGAWCREHNVSSEAFITEQWARLAYAEPEPEDEDDELDEGGA